VNLSPLTDDCVSVYLSPANSVRVALGPGVQEEQPEERQNRHGVQKQVRRTANAIESPVHVAESCERHTADGLEAVIFSSNCDVHEKHSARAEM
jgi:hypothetical protein